MVAAAGFLIDPLVLMLSGSKLMLSKASGFCCLEGQGGKADASVAPAAANVQIHPKAVSLTYHHPRFIFMTLQLRQRRRPGGAVASPFAWVIQI